MQTGIQRVKAIKSLRFNNKKSLREIGEIYGISRERVRQIVGNSGKHKGGFNACKYFAFRENPNLIAEFNHLTNPELKKMGIPVKFGRSKHRHAIASNSPSVNLGRKSEEIVSHILTEQGLKNKLMPYSYPYDILVADKIRIDVKSASRPTKNQPRGKSPRWHFRIRHNEHKCDFYYCLILHENKKISFIVPSNIATCCDIIFAYPTLRPEIGKYQRYIDRFDLIKNAIVMLNTIKK